MNSIRLLILVLSSAGLVFADDPQHTIQSAVYSTPVITVVFSKPLAVPPSVVVNSDSGAVSIDVPVFAPNGHMAVRIAVTGVAPSDITEVRFSSVRFNDGTNVATLVHNVEKGGVAEETVAGLMSKVAQIQSDKSIFASGLVTTASSGTAGAGDISLNSFDLGVPNLKAFLHLKRSTTKQGDPKNFEFGAHYTSVFLMSKEASSSGTFAATLLDFALKSEGTASRFGVENTVGETSAALQSPVQNLGPASSAKFRIITGFEGGSNTSKGNSPAGPGPFASLQNVDWLARAKGGIEGSVNLVNKGHRWPFQSLELRAAGVYRYLFLDELNYNQSTNAVDSVAQGHKPYGQVDLKVIVGQANNANYGLKLTFQNGSLPPVFANTRAFQFGFLYETKDRTGN